MTSRKVVIVGAGLFGSIAATLARRRGHQVTVVDNRESMAASKASGCVLAPSWLTSLSDEQRKRGMDVLNRLYNVQEITFQTNLIKEFKAQRVDPQDIIVAPDMVGSVLTVSDGVVVMNDGKKIKGQVLVAAGIWSAQLVSMPPVRGLYGCSVLFNGHLPLAKIHAYAPYRQAVAFEIRRGKVWFGDGTALIQKTWEEEGPDRIVTTTRRGLELLNAKTAKGVVNEGARPYVEGYKAGYFARCGAHTWVSTGGAKNGTVLAADQAGRFIEEAGL